MKCPDCQFENREDAKFCSECGQRFTLSCPDCGTTNRPDAKFCDECGLRLDQGLEAPVIVQQPEGERKQVTVVFSDFSGFTALSEKLDPEEVKEIMSRVFGEIAGVVARYGGFIEKFVGDAVMAIFGVPKSHEDDPIRAIKAARGIHDLVETLSPKLEEKAGGPISMHTGVNTGLVVTGEVDVEKGTHGVSGDTVNLASRLSSLAQPGEILVGPDTYRRTEGYFEFRKQEPKKVKGKSDPVEMYEMVSVKEAPVTLHRLSGLRADLIGRKVEMAQLQEAVERLREGTGKIFSICGNPGTGKSRLVEEFKATLNLDEIRWLEAHAYAYSQNIPYFTLIDLLNRMFGMEEGDPPEEVREKLESGIGDLIGRESDAIPFVGGLFSIQYPEIENVSPEFWKAKLREGMLAILSALARKVPTVFCLEDLHWADPSFIELLRSALTQIRQPAVVLCVYRPTFSLFTSHQLASMTEIYQEIRLQDLSSSEAQDMLDSLLKTHSIPADLRRVVQDKAEGNPFYVEELVNSLIESGTLVKDNGDWKVTKPISRSDISSTIHGVISGRLDRLENETKRILQEASVIGRAFLYEILKKISFLQDRIDESLGSLERLDLIRMRSLQPELEYIFKHALTQEVVYNGLLIKERKHIHERIGLVMEELFRDRLPEFYEALAFHFRRGHSDTKAVKYLVKSGEKSLARYAVEESHQYFREAFEILSNKTERSDEEDNLLITLIVKWSYVYYYKGNFKELIGLLSVHEALAARITDRSTAGMFYGWLGMTLWSKQRYRESQRQLMRALEIGESLGDKKVVGYACTWLSWTCAELGLLEDALQYGAKAQRLAGDFPSDHYLFLKSLGGVGFTRYYRGEANKALEAGNALVAFGEKNSDIRSMVMGHYVVGLGHFAMRDLERTIESHKRAIQVSADPYYRQFPLLFLGMGFLLTGRFSEARKAFEEVVAFSVEWGVEMLETAAKALLGACFLTSGEFEKGFKLVQESRKRFEEAERKWCIALADRILGQFYLQVVTSGKDSNFSLAFKNIRFLAVRLPFAAKRAEEHFVQCHRRSEEMGANLLAGEAYVGLAQLYTSKGKKEKAVKCISAAIQRLEECGSEGPLKEAREMLASISRPPQ
jgi:predicted ATPase/class 3 adenylate cyclase